MQTDNTRNLNTSVLLFDRPFVSSKTNKRVCRFQQLSKITLTGKYRCRCIQSRPSHCFQADSGSLRAASGRLHASRANLNPINKYMLFYGRFRPNYANTFPPFLLHLSLCGDLQNPVLFVSKTRTGRHSPEASGFIYLFIFHFKRCAVLHGGKKPPPKKPHRSPRQSLRGTNLL